MKELNSKSRTNAQRKIKERSVIKRNYIFTVHDLTHSTLEEQYLEREQRNNNAVQILN